MSTIPPIETNELIALANKSSIDFLDAPVGRTSAHAKTGKLIIFAGAKSDEKVIQKVQPLFDAMGEKTIYMGERCAGSKIKIINNFMSICMNAVSAETINFAETIGLKYEKVQEVFNLTPAGLGHFKTTWPGKVLSNDL